MQQSSSTPSSFYNTVLGNELLESLGTTEEADFGCNWVQNSLDKFPESV